MLAAVRAVAPALANYTDARIVDELWKRPDLKARDRSIVTLSALIARNQTIGIPHYTNLALDYGVEPGEISELVTHLAFYAGWSNAFSAIMAIEPVFAQRAIDVTRLPSVSPMLLPLDEAAEAQRAAHVGAQFGESFPGMVQNTTDILFRDLWLRPARTGSFPPEPGHGQWPDTGTSGGSRRASGLLCGLALRLFGNARREGCIRKARKVRWKPRKP
jgi:4-carboxymuconolactone decarboxylase